MINVKEVYDNYILDKRDENFSNRYEGNEAWYHGSGTGLCMRKHYFQSVHQIPPTEKDSDTMRLFRLGDLVHGDIQTAVKLDAEKNGYEVYIEEEVQIPTLNVRSFIDLMTVKDGIIYDIKTCNDWKWKSMFGKYGDGKPSNNYALQLGTYGLYYKEQGHEIKGLTLAFYNKNNSHMQELNVDLSFIQRAKDYWLKVEELFKEGIPPIIYGIAPVEKWECNKKYCSFFEACGGGMEFPKATKWDITDDEKNELWETNK